MPDFRLTATEADALASFIRDKSTGAITEIFPPGDAIRGEKLFIQNGCQQCHEIGTTYPVKPPAFAWDKPDLDGGCLAEDLKVSSDLPVFGFQSEEREALVDFLKFDLNSIQKSSVVETSTRLYRRLQCANCHDRDGQRAHRALVLMEEGSGQIPEQVPQLTLAGEKLRPAWTERMLAGKLEYKSRPWLTARMPAFPAYASALAHGLGAEHGIDAATKSTQFDAKLASIGEELTLQTGLDCRQCHAIGNMQPRGDKETEIAIGINFTHIRDRLRRDAYDRFMLDPPRYDIKTKMIRLSEDGLTTKLKTYFDADAKQQFGAVWHYIQSLPDRGQKQNAQENRK